MTLALPSLPPSRHASIAWCQSPQSSLSWQHRRAQTFRTINTNRNGWQIRLAAPRNWQLTEQTSYPNVLLWMARPPEGRMLLSGEKVAADETALKYAARTTVLLETMGFTLRAPQLHSATGAYLVDFNNAKIYLRQAFLVIDGIGYARFQGGCAVQLEGAKTEQTLCL